MTIRRTTHRECRDNEREWQGFCVDKNLEDEWLERLNALKAFDLISICEGHRNRQQQPAITAPHIRLRLRDDLLSGISRHWDEHKMAVMSEVNRLFETEGTSVSLDLRFRLRMATGRLSYREELVVGVNGHRARASDEIRADTHTWFERHVHRIEELDTHIVNLWNGTSPDSSGDLLPSA